MAFISAGTPGIRTAQRPSCSNQAPGAVPWALGIFSPRTGTMACLRLLGVVARPIRVKKAVILAHSSPSKVRLSP